MNLFILVHGYAIIDITSSLSFWLGGVYHPITTFRASVLFVKAALCARELIQYPFSGISSRRAGNTRSDSSPEATLGRFCLW